MRKKYEPDVCEPIKCFERYRMKGKEELLVNELLNGEQNDAFEENQPHRESFKGRESTREREVATKTKTLLNGSFLLKSKSSFVAFWFAWNCLLPFYVSMGKTKTEGERGPDFTFQKMNKKRAMRKTVWGTVKRGRGKLLKLRLWMWIDSSILTIAPCRLCAVNLTYDWFLWSVCVLLCVCEMSS